MTLNTFEESRSGTDFNVCENATFDVVPASTSMRPVNTKRKMSLLEYQRTERKKNVVVILKGMMLLLHQKIYYVM